MDGNNLGQMLPGLPGDFSSAGLPFGGAGQQPASLPAIRTRPAARTRRVSRSAAAAAAAGSGGGVGGGGQPGSEGGADGSAGLDLSLTMDLLMSPLMSPLGLSGNNLSGKWGHNELLRSGFSCVCLSAYRHTPPPPCPCHPLSPPAPPSLFGLLLQAGGTRPSASCHRETLPACSQVWRVMQSRQ